MEAPDDLVALRAILADMPEAADRLGLLLTAKLNGPAYDQTPRNCVTFARTGGDGVHFSFLLKGGGPQDDPPIVMTVPMAEQPNRVVGRNLRHFLGLGLASGYFILEQLQYDFAGMVDELERRAWERELSPEARELLGRLAREFALVGWSDHGAQLQALEREFGGLFDIAG